MEKLIVSEKESNSRYIAYIAGILSGRTVQGAAVQIGFDSGRVTLSAEAESLGELKELAAEKIAEVLCVGYKYDLFSRLIRPSGLSAEDREILLAAIIAADFAEDYRYIHARLRDMSVHTIDGFFLFRLQALREKWKSIAACVPSCFDGKQLAEFMEYLLGGSRRKIFLKGKDVYDCRCCRLRRAALIDGGKSEMNTFREIVLSGAGKIECLSALSASQENFLRRYYPGRVGFSLPKNSFSEQLKSVDK
ncbi:MAG TPA: hypothetical protein H9731_04255 [Candidatus Borkfalkia excrementipullorum]|nr:hypothetical protein [Candidatus Borkfalkia excrementipullorum]